ncbi:MAG: retroviral-like aspartic protease family protein [Scytonema sp. PMC 1069.18]|nr:retroviral-like aspartic protease family protein [Scytonema sp. PMC 1069.18]MEC4885998.1 retroviral-like aspartic protease family protein [Scytonema sp. PMC 1070.18]
MFQPILSRTALILLSSTLLVATVACQKNKQTTALREDEQFVYNEKSVATPASSAATTPAAPTPKPELVTQPPELELSYFEQGLDKAIGAFTISQSAQSKDDWNLVATELQDAIALMKKVSVESPYFSNAQGKIAEYQQQFKYAVRRANQSVTPPPLPEPEKIAALSPTTTVEQDEPEPKKIVKPSSPALPPEKPSPIPKFSVESPESTKADSIPIPVKRQNEPPIYTAPIKRRVAGTPIIEVTFNGNQNFEMIVDTGASGTVITQKMASALGVVPVAKARANTASSKAVEFPVGYVNSIKVGGVEISRVPVAIAGTELDTGLLGHDFFGNYDITIKRNVVEFRPQSPSQVNSKSVEIPVPLIPTVSREPQPIEVPPPN